MSLIATLVRSMPVGLIANLRWQYLANIAVAVLGGLYLLVLGRFLGATDFGLYSVCTAYAALMFGVVELRLQEATIRFVDFDGHQNESVTMRIVEALFTVDVVLKLVVGAVSLIGAPIVAQRLSLGADAQNTMLLCFANLFVAKTGNSVATGLLRSANLFNVHAIVLLAEWFARLSLTLMLVMVGDLSLSSILIVSIMIGLLSNIILIARACRAVGFRPEYLLVGNRTELTKSLSLMLSFIVPSYGISLLDNIAKEADVAVVALSLPLPAVGVYKMAKSMVLILWKAADPFFLVVMPTLVKFIRDGNVVGVKQFLVRFTVLLAVVAAIMVSTSMVVVPIISPFILGPEFSGVGEIFRIMVLWVIVSLPLIWTHAYAAAISRPALQLAGNLLGNGILLILLFALTPHWGLIGAAIAWAIGLAACFVGALCMLWITDAFGEKVIGQAANAR
jgi:O-antigen/teichoic acid export membrane protein